jgi:ssDNA-binding Zn-finger/Zn-ribbon topoisomerase 1
MTLAEYEKLPSNEKEHFFECPECGQFVDKRELRNVIFHVTGHKPKPEIPRNKEKAIPKQPSEPLGSDGVS